MKYKDYYKYNKKNEIDGSHLGVVNTAISKLRDTKFGLYSNPIGIEIELEKFVLESIPEHGNTNLWFLTEDTSLKISGTEMVSYPIQGRQIDLALEQYSDYLKAMPPNCPLCSHRCSTHVHVNIRELTQPRLLAFIATYACLEQLFFSLVEDHRHGNGYCYPITDLLPSSYHIVSFHPDMKYCAFNTGSVKTYGTVEFRHHHATTDIKALTRWLQLICKLYQYIEKTDPQAIRNKIMGLNSTSAYMEFVDTIFAPLGFMFNNMELKELMEDSVAWSKAFLASNKTRLSKELSTTNKAPQDIPMYDLLASLGPQTIESEEQYDDEPSQTEEMDF